MNKQQLASKIWTAANKMRSKIAANEYKDYILGFIFYKFLSERQTEYFKSMGASEEDIKEIVESEDYKDEIENSKNNIGYFIAYDNLYSTWLEKGLDFNIKDVSVALSAFSRNIGENHRNVYVGIFDELEKGLNKLGGSATEQTKSAKDLIKLIKDIPMDNKDGYDVLGYIYEYLIGNFAAGAGKKGGEFYTPATCSLLMAMLISHHLQGEKEIKIYDPCSGSGSLLLHIGKCIEKYNHDKDCVKYYAQENIQSTYNLTRMNLVLRGVKPGNIVTRCGDSLDKDWPYFDDNDPEHTYEPLMNLSAVSMNPPYSQGWEPSTHTSDPRFSYGLAPSSKADYAFLLHGFYHLKDGGIQTIVLPHGVLFRGGDEETIRKNLLENNHIDTIIGLPANIFYGTGIPTIIMVLKKGREDKDVLFIDASKGFAKMGKKNDLRERDIKKIFDTCVSREDIPNYSRKVSLEEIRRNGYNLNIPRYIDSSDKAENIDLYASMFGGVPKAEIDALCADEFKAFPSLKDEMFVKTDTPYTSLKVADIKKTTLENKEVKSFIETYNKIFSTFGNELKVNLVENKKGAIDEIEEKITNIIFNNLKEIPLVDRYEAYQYFASLWKTISADLEIIKTEGEDAIYAVDPNMVTKKDSEAEVQEGWKGRILPFELIQEKLMQEDLEQIKALKDKIESIQSECAEIIEDIPEEERGDAVNEDGKFNEKAELLKPYLGKKAKVATEDSIIKLLNVKALKDTEKASTKELKKITSSLDAKTKELIESRNFNADEMLFAKWVKPLWDDIMVLPNNILKNFADKLESLNKKYAITMVDTESEIEKSESELVNMLGDLTGSDYDLQGLEAFKKLLGGN